jgi:AbrB family looped-hinge helix DNA binding protein
MARYEFKSDRPSRTREASPAYGTPRSTAYAVTMADRGRLVLPAEVRERLNIKGGDRLLVRVDPDGTIRLQTGAAFARSLRGVFKHLAPGRSLSDELIAERRREAAQEERETQAFLARHRAKAHK